MIPHGVDVDEYGFLEEASRLPYLLSIGRIARVKGQDVAIAVAKRSGAKLILAGCVQNKREDRAFFSSLERSLDLVVDVARHPVNDDYFERVMKPILSSDERIIYIGELGTEAKKHWFRHAQATLFPIRWGEPFGMVLIESMASGTPIVAFGRGSVPEIVRDGKTGFVVDSVDAMVKAVEGIERIDRRDCRNHVAKRFSLQRMAQGYEAMYRQLAHSSASGSSAIGERLALQRRGHQRITSG
jgi:glycosyltransferase involved in cell wall biosynthesis